MLIAIAGSTGLVGSALVRFWTNAGHRILRLVRRDSHLIDDGTTPVSWDPTACVLDPVSLEGIDAVVNLAGESIATGRWTTAKKQRILDSRVKSTSLLAWTLAKLRSPPGLFFSASAVGYYPPSGDRILT